MIVSLSNAGKAWETVLTGGPGPVVIFCASPDPDALATARTLTQLLQADLVRYELQPVSGYGHLRAAFRALVSGPAAVHPRAVLCVNCGASVDLATVLNLETEDDNDSLTGNDSDEEEKLIVYVMDSHRPFHLRNIRSSRVCVFDDSMDKFQDADLPLDIGWEDEWGNVQNASSDSESGSDDGSEASESDMESDAESQNSQVSSESRRSVDSEENGDDDDESVQPNDDGEDSVSGRKRSRRQSQGKKKRRTRRRRTRENNKPMREERRALREYYAAAPAGMASACVSYHVARMQRRASHEHLWSAIVGFTHQYLCAAVQSSVYDEAASWCRSQISELSPDTLNSDGGGFDGPVMNAGYGAGKRDKDGTTASGRVIVPSSEYRLDLVRHWSLFESLLYSSYTLTRMAAWRQTGRRRVMELLATLGIPLSESKQKWCYMKPECKAALDDRLLSSVRRFDLGKDIQYDSFLRILPGYQGSISAADVVQGLSALLELDSITDSSHDAHGKGVDAEKGEKAYRFRRAAEARFWRAYDALDAFKPRGLQRGLNIAIRAQRVAAQVGSEVIERRRFIASGAFRYVFLRDVHNKEVFSQPLMLRRLALFLVEAMVRQGAKDKPFIVVAPDPAQNTWLAVAALTAGLRNDFGQRFRRAAEKIGSQISFDSFDSAVCEIQDGQESDFIRYLHDIMV